MPDSIGRNRRKGERRKPPGPLKGEEREEGEMPTGSRRNTKNLTAAKMPPKKNTVREKEKEEINRNNKEEEINRRGNQ